MTACVRGVVGGAAVAALLLASGPAAAGTAALDLSRAVRIKSDRVAVDANELKAAGVDAATFTPPRRLKGSSPSYPEAAAGDNAQGTVLLECVISEAGAVRDCRITRAVHPAIDRAALRAIQRGKYEPALVTGEPRSIVAEFMMIFRLE